MAKDFAVPGTTRPSPGWRAALDRISAALDEALGALDAGKQRGLSRAQGTTQTPDTRAAMARIASNQAIWDAVLDRARTSVAQAGDELAGVERTIHSWLGELQGLQRELRGP